MLSRSSTIMRSTSPGSHTSIMLTGRSWCVGTRKALSMPMKWPTGAPVIVGGPAVGNMRASWRVSQPIVRCEWTTPLGSRVVPEVNPMRAGASGSTADGPATGSAPGRAGDGGGGVGGCGGGVSATRQPSGGRVAAEDLVPHGEVLAVAEPVGGHDQVGLGGPHDVLDLLGPVEVDDRHHHRPEVG